MYSAVLMLALTAGSDSVEFGKARCHGCSSTYSSCTYVAPVVYTPTYSCSTSYSSCHSSCHTGLLARMRERKCHCTPTCSVVYTTPTTCTTGVPVVVPPVKKDMPPKDMPKVEKIDGPKKASLHVPATIVVSLPADARLIVDGTPTTSTSSRRTLVTPVLENGTTYVYTMQAEVIRDGRVETQSQQVTVRGGETSNVQFNFSTQTVASR